MSLYQIEYTKTVCKWAFLLLFDFLYIFFYIRYDNQQKKISKKVQTNRQVVIEKDTYNLFGVAVSFFSPD